MDICMPKKTGIVLDRKLKNIILNEHEFAAGKIVLKSYPRQLHILLNSKCNLQCEMCGMFKGRYKFSDRHFKELIKLMPYLQLLIIQGGEIFLDSRINTILKYALKNKVKVDLLTNGLLINEKIADQLADAGVNLVFSIDSPFKETYESIRLGAKFEKLINNIIILNEARKLKKTCIKTAINMVVMKKNYKHIEAMIEFSKKYKFNALILSTVTGSLTDDRKEKFSSLKINNEILEEFTTKIALYKKQANQAGISLFNHIPLDSFKKNAVSENYAASDFCRKPFLRITMDDKEYSPDCRCPEKMKIKKQKSILSMWNSRIMQNYRKAVLDCAENSICTKCFCSQKAEV